MIGNKSASGTEIIEELGRGRDSYGIYDRVYVGGFGYADLREMKRLSIWKNCIGAVRLQGGSR